MRKLEQGDKEMSIKNTNYKSWLILAIIAIAGWLVGYFVRWDKTTNRPFVRRCCTPDKPGENSKGPIVEGLID